MVEVLISVLLLQSFFSQIRGDVFSNFGTVPEEMLNMWNNSEVNIYYPNKAKKIQSVGKNRPKAGFFCCGVGRDPKYTFLSVKPDCYGYLLSTRHVLTPASCFMERTNIKIEKMIVAQANFGGIVSYSPDDEDKQIHTSKITKVFVNTRKKAKPSMYTKIFELNLPTENI